MKRLTFLLGLLFCFGLFTAESCSKKEDLLGDWAYEITDTPEGDFNGIMTLTEEDKGYSGMIGSDSQKAPLENLKIDDGTFSFSFDYGQYRPYVSGKIEDGVFKGTVSVEGEAFPFEAKRAE